MRESQTRIVNPLNGCCTANCTLWLPAACHCQPVLQRCCPIAAVRVMDLPGHQQAFKLYPTHPPALCRLMDRPQLVHIGHHVIPNALAQEMKVYAFQHDGYWHVRLL